MVLVVRLRASVCVRACVCACVRACVRASVWVRVVGLGMLAALGLREGDVIGADMCAAGPL